MKKKNAVALILLVSSGLLVGCQRNAASSSFVQSAQSSASLSHPVTLGAVTGLAFRDGKLTFNPVEGAEGYKIDITHRSESVYSSSISATEVDISSLELSGNLTAKVKAYKGLDESPEAKLDFVVKVVFADITIEAENYLYNFGTGKATSNFRNNTLAHGGAYVGGIDDAGQGIYINLLSPVAGTFDFDGYYLTDMNPAYNDVWVNGVSVARFAFSEKTGWGGEGSFSPAKATVSIPLKKGWNTISVMKNGDSSDNWGSYAELDYFVLHGDKSEYNPDDLLTYSTKPATYRLEAEMGSPRKKSNGLNTVKNPCIKQDDTNKYSNGFLMGGIESAYDGVEWHIYSEEKSQYTLKAGYASGQNGSYLSFYVSQESIALTHDADFAEMTPATIKSLENTGWNKVAVTSSSATITLESGDNYLYCLKASDSGIYQLDYVDMSFVSLLS
jgi:hypothetical protein